LFVSTLPVASSTARETMFSEAINSIWFCCRPSSLVIDPMISGSRSASGVVKKPSALTPVSCASSAVIVGRPL